MNRELKGMRQANGGKLTNAEKKAVNQQQNKLSNQIYDKNHNGKKGLLAKRASLVGIWMRRRGGPHGRPYVTTSNLPTPTPGRCNRKTFNAAILSEDFIILRLTTEDENHVVLSEAKNLGSSFRDRRMGTAGILRFAQDDSA